MIDRRRGWADIGASGRYGTTPGQGPVERIGLEWRNRIECIISECHTHIVHDIVTLFLLLLILILILLFH